MKYKPLNEEQQELVMQLHRLTKGHGFLDRNYPRKLRVQLDDLRTKMRAARIPDYILYGKMGLHLD